MFKYLYTIILLVSSLVSNGQTNEEKQVSDLVEIFNKAIINKDTGTLEKILLNELSYGHSNGLVQDKASFIHKIIAGPNFFTAIDLQNQTIKIVGDMAIVRHLVTAKVINKGSPGVLKFGNVLILLKRNKNWKFIVRQAYKIN
jgi:hypothetical protein